MSLSFPDKHQCRFHFFSPFLSIVRCPIPFPQASTSYTSPMSAVIDSPASLHINPTTASRARPRPGWCQKHNPQYACVEQSPQKVADHCQTPMGHLLVPYSCPTHVKGKQENAPPNLLALHAPDWAPNPAQRSPPWPPQRQISPV